MTAPLANGKQIAKGSAWLMDFKLLDKSIVLICALVLVLVTSASLDRLSLLGTLPSWLKATIVGRYLRYLANSRIAYKAWGPESIYDAMHNADIYIIPIEVDPVRDPSLRKRVGQQAWQTALERYSMDRQAERLIEVLHAVVGRLPRETVATEQARA